MQEVTLNLLYLINQDQVMLAMKKRGFGVGRYNGIGGKVEPGETIEQALVREAQEEIGITPIDFEKIADINFDEYFKGEPTIMHVHVYKISKWEGNPIESEEVAPDWFAINDLPYANMWPNDLHWLPLVLDGQKITAQFKLDINDEVVSHNIEIVEEF